MRTGIGFNNDVDTEPLYHTRGSSVDFILSHPKRFEPGLAFGYNDGAPHLLSAAIQQRTGSPMSVFADDNLFKPMGISDWKWESSNDGVTFGAVSLFLKPRDAAKFGQLLIQNGNWNNQQLVDSNWVLRATQPRVNTHIPSVPYGYYFWIYPSLGTFSADGHGGQKISVVRSKNLVIVYTAWGYTKEAFFDNFNEVADLIVKSCY